MGITKRQVSRPPDLPRHIRDADLASCLLVVVEPVALGEIDVVERGIRLYTLRLPHALAQQSVKNTRT